MSLSADAAPVVAGAPAPAPATEGPVVVGLDLRRRGCSVDGCPDPHEARGMCNRHYLRWKTHGTTDDSRPTLPERFWAKVDKAGPIPRHRPDLGPCWTWAAVLNPAGYGHFSVGGRSGGMAVAHRVAYELLVGPIPDGLELDHLCRTRACVNPAHLEPVTHAENSRRSSAGQVNGDRQRAITQCPQGHPYDEANTSYRANGRRRCKACERARTARWRASQ